MKKILFLGALFLMMVGCKSQKEMVSLDKQTNEVTLKKGQTVEIAFTTNASLGYWWTLANKDEITVVDSVDNRYERTAPEGMVGAASNRYWKFQAVKKGTETLHFVYARDKVEETTIKTRDVVVTVK
ncbi:MAG: protease inhibitor I42 family protein [Bacteroidales bacterium]|nr:protease inhibitor I42 family protein [Bacteroidales bacterium]